jgi:hypothetical protein
MNEYVIKSVGFDGRNWVVNYDAPDGTPWAHSFPVGNLETLMAEYGLDDPAEALDVLLHDPHAWAWIGTLDPRDDPAAVAGWVTTDLPDAEPVTLFNARSTTDARGAHRARIAAVKEAGATAVVDPDGLLAEVLSMPLDDAKQRDHAEQVDVYRWQLVYGGLPDQTPPLPLDADPGIPLISTLRG